MASSKRAVSVQDTTPLLLPKGRDVEEPFEGIPGASTSSAVFNLLTSIIGAGIMALPATQRQLGIGVGLMTIVLVGILTDASLEFLIRFSKACKATSYGSVMAEALGPPGRTLVQLCVIINNVGLLVVYMIIIGDVLSGSGTGSSHHTGVLEEMAGGSVWWNGRIFILFFTTVAIILPLVSFKRVDSLRFSSALSIALAVVFVAITAVITIVKLANNDIAKPRLWPELNDQFSFWKLFTAVPVIVTAFICHHSVHPIANELDDSASIQKICRVTISICTLVYISTALFGYLLFGDNTMDDILSNFDADLGIPYGQLLSTVVRVGYAVHLMLVFPLIHFSLRLNLDALIFPHSSPLTEDTHRFTMITAFLVVVVFIGSTLVPNIWTAFQFTGATAAVCLAFIFPAIVALRDKPRIGTKSDKMIALVMMGLAVVSSVTAIVSNIYDLVRSDRSSSSGRKGVRIIF